MREEECFQELKKKTFCTNCLGVPRPEGPEGEIVLVTDNGFRWVSVPVRFTATARSAHAVHNLSQKDARHLVVTPGDQTVGHWPQATTLWLPTAMPCIRRLRRATSAQTDKGPRIAVACNGLPYAWHPSAHIPCDMAGSC